MNERGPRERASFSLRNLARPNLARPPMLCHRTGRAGGTVPRNQLSSTLCSHHIFQPESFMRRLFILAGIAASMLGAFVIGAYAQDRVRAGVLECRGGASIGFIVGSVTNLGCVFRVEGFPEDRYVATIRKVGVDLGITQETALGWAVYAPVARLGPGDLSGDYAGAQGSAAVGVGLGGN